MMFAKHKLAVTSAELEAWSIAIDIAQSYRSWQFGNRGVVTDEQANALVERKLIGHESLRERVLALIGQTDAP